MLAKNDAHPPHNVAAADSFLYDVWQAVHSSPQWNYTLLVITFDEHGGCYDHVPPPWTAVRPDDHSTQQPYGLAPYDFGFNRYGVRVPAIVVSPWVEAGTVFRAASTDASGGAEFDHTSILATLRDWLGLKAPNWLASKRIEKAPTLGHVLTLSKPRTDVPVIEKPRTPLPVADTALNDIQRALTAASLIEAQAGSLSLQAYNSVAEEVTQKVASLKTVGDAVASLTTGLSKGRAAGMG
jgi:phospholipase C